MVTMIIGEDVIEGSSQHQGEYLQNSSVYSSKFSEISGVYVYLKN